MTARRSRRIPAVFTTVTAGCVTMMHFAGFGTAWQMLASNVRIAPFLSSLSLPNSSPVWRPADAHWNVSQPLGALLPQTIDRGGDVVLYTSNIGNWVRCQDSDCQYSDRWSNVGNSDRWLGLLKGWVQEAAGYGARLYAAGRKTGWGSAGWYAQKLA